MTIRYRLVAVLLALLAGIGTGTALANPAEAAQPATADLSYFAIVNDYEIGAEVFIAALRREARERFYHGRLTEERFETLKQEVAQQLIDNTLLTLEAERLGIEPDAAQVERDLARMEQRFGEDPAFATQRESILAGMRLQFKSRQRMRQLEAQVRASATPDAAQLREYYRKHPEQFTTPEKHDIAAILIKVPPSSSSEEWQQTEALMQTLHTRIGKGESFAALAEEYSHAPSASQGGEMGALHRGTLHQDVEAALDVLEPGQLSAPVRLLEGYVMVRLNRRVPASLNSYEESRERVVELATRSQAEQLWQDYLQGLRDAARVVLNDRMLKLSLD